MTENHKQYMIGNVKLVIAREFADQDWQIVSYRLWVDQFDYGLDYGSKESYFIDVLYTSDLQQDYNSEVAKLTNNEKSVGVFELIAEVHGESWKSWTDCGYEYDAREWLEKVRVQELKGDPLQWFKEEQSESWAYYFGE